MILYILLSIRKYIYMLQQNFYNENNRYLKWLFNQKITLIEIISIVICTVNFISSKFMILYIVLLILRLIDHKKEQNKLKFNITRRIICLFITTMIIYIMTFILLIDDIKYFNILVLLIPIMVYISNIINYPLENIIFLTILNKSKNKLKKLNINVIGITGSYGKTSTKNILNEILNSKYKSVASIKNYNTLKGLSIMIKKLNKFDEYFIAEMGAYKKGSIKKLCNLVNPRYAIITNIGLSHLETFKTKENILKTKFELVESLPTNGLAILNYDDELIKNYKLKNTCKIIWIGLNNKADVYANNIEISKNIMKFNITFKEKNITKKFTTKLLGKENIYNILSSVALSYYLGVDLDKIVNSVSKLKSTSHRLELKKLNNYYILDDAYNSNPVGANMALETLNMMDGIKIVVTPGMVEFGKMQDTLNNEFGKNISKIADYVILVGQKQTNQILKGLLSKNYKKDKITIINDVKKSFDLINDIAIKNKNKEVYVLYENDLPDIYNE